MIRKFAIAAAAIAALGTASLTASTPAAAWGKGGGWGHHGYGYGPGWGKGGGPGGSESWRGDRDSRIAEWKITFADTVADNGSSAFFVLGNERRPLQGLDLRTCGMALEINGKVASLGAGVACLGHPLNAAAYAGRSIQRSPSRTKRSRRSPRKAAASACQIQRSTAISSFFTRSTLNEFSSPRPRVDVVVPAWTTSAE